MSCSISLENNAILTCFSSEYFEFTTPVPEEILLGFINKGNLSILPDTIYGYHFKCVLEFILSSIEGVMQKNDMCGIP